MFVWDEDKRRRVATKHGVDFAQIVDVFEDAYAYDFDDDEHSEEDELRYGLIGRTAKYGLIFLAYSVTVDDNVRFITARRAERWMITAYEENRRRL